MDKIIRNFSAHCLVISGHKIAEQVVCALCICVFKFKTLAKLIDKKGNFQRIKKRKKLARYSVYYTMHCIIRKV